VISSFVVDGVSVQHNIVYLAIQPNEIFGLLHAESSI